MIITYKDALTWVKNKIFTNFSFRIQNPECIVVPNAVEFQKYRVTQKNGPLEFRSNYVSGENIFSFNERY